MSFTFKRENRGPSSDVYAIIDDETDVIKGRLDLHFYSDGVSVGQ